MSAPPDTTTGESGTPGLKQRIIHPCNFRYAGRLSNENARFLTALHEKFALSATNSLELYLGASLRLKLISLEQLAQSDYIAGIAQSSYILPFSLDVMNSNCLMDMEIGLILPIIDLLLGGMGSGCVDHELTEMDEEVVESVSSLLVKELERCWRALNLSLTPGHCIKPGMVQHLFPANEKLVVLRYEMTLGDSVSGLFTIALPTPFVGYLLRHMKVSQSKKVTDVGRVHGPNLRERILDREFVLCAEVLNMRVLLMDLVGLQPGNVLRTSAPVKKPVKLTVDGVELFDSVPVRDGDLKAAQIITKVQDPASNKEQI